MNKSKIKKSICYGITIICAAVFLYAAVQLYQIFSAQNKSSEYNKSLADISIKYNSDSSDSTDSTDDADGAQEELSPLSVDFDALYAESKDAVAWIYCENTPINYPVAQSTDNQKYLNCLLDGSYSVYGTIFEDYRNSPDFSDLNTILYGHSMNNGSMFGTLSNYKEQSYYDAHPVMYLITPQHDYRIELIGGYVTESESDAYSIPQTVEQRDALIQTARQNSTFYSAVQTSESDRIITLSTCSYEYDNARYVLVGKLVKTE